MRKEEDIEVGTCTGSMHKELTKFMEKKLFMFTLQYVVGQ